jgi:hypothetical protein
MIFSQMMAKLPADTGTMPRDEITMMRYLALHEQDVDAALSLYEENTRWRMKQFKVNFPDADLCDCVYSLYCSFLFPAPARDGDVPRRVPV